MATQKFRYIFIDNSANNGRGVIVDVMEFNGPKKSKKEVCKYTAWGERNMACEMRVEPVGAPDPSRWS